MAKLPALQFYPGDWKKDPGVQSLSFHDRGVWFEILLIMHESSERGKLLLNGRPMPDDALARLLGLDKQILTNTLTKLLDYGVASREADSNTLVCRRMVRDEELRKIRKKCGEKGGNPILLNQKSNQNGQPPVNQKSTPSSSTSSSTSVNISPLPPRGGMEELSESLWKECPKLGRERSSKSKLIAALKKLPAKATSDPETLVASLRAWKASESWAKDNGQFVPAIHRWVGDGKWQTPPEPLETKSPFKKRPWDF